MTQKLAIVVDDEPDAVNYHTTLLTEQGWRVRSALSADEGLALAREEKPDVVLLDLMMPDRGGLNTLVEIRKDPQLKGVSVILVSGIQERLVHDFKRFLGRFKHHLPDAYIEKPIDTEELVKVLEKVSGA
jgi:CheY-like chemotaxis protein